MVTITSLRTFTEPPAPWQGFFDIIGFIVYIRLFLLSEKSISRDCIYRFNEFINKIHLSIILKVQRYYCI